MVQILSAKVKNVISSDTVILVPPKSSQVPVPERMLTLSYVKPGNSFESKEFVRNLLIGKEIKFKVNFKHPTTGKEFGDIQSPIFTSLTEYLVERGIVELKDNIDESDFTDNLLDLQQKAKLKNAGIWGSNPKIELIEVDESIIAKSQKNSITTIVEKVINGDRIIGRILVNKTQHISTPLLLAGIKCPRTDDINQSKNLTLVANQAKQFVEEKLLTTKDNIKIKIVGESQNGIPIAILEHPSGNNIHEKMLEKGFGEIVDWQSTLIGSQTMSVLRRAEQTAKALGKGIYDTGKTISAPTVSGKITAKHLRPGLNVDNVVVSRVLQADTLNVKLPSGEEKTVQLASLRSPKQNDSTITTNQQYQLALVNSAREFVRQQVAGKTVSMYIDGFRTENKDLGLESRFTVSIKVGQNDLSEMILNKGWATVIKHNKQTIDERSLNWDKLVEIEEQQKKLGKHGIYFKGDISKVLTVGTRIVDASENLSRSKSFFSNFKQKGRISGGYHVEFIPSVNRVKLFNPKEGLKLTLILGGLANEKSEFSDKGLEFMNTKFLQKNVEFDIYDLDKIGGFIGNLYLNSNSLKPVQVNLLENGFVKLHDIAVGSNAFENDFVKAEESAKASKKGLWSKDQVANVTSALKEVSITKPSFHDIEVTYIDSNGVIYYQQLDSATKNKFATFKQDFDDFHQQNPSATSTSYDLPFNLTKPPKKNDLVSVKLEDNGKYYRGRILSFDKSSNLFEVRHLDYGNVDEVPLSSLRVLPTFFSIQTIPVFSHSCKLRFVKLPPTKPVNYLNDALDLLDELTFEKTLVINALPLTNDIAEFDVILYDSQESLKDASYTINRKLVEEGMAIVDDAIKSDDPLFIELKKVQQKAIEGHKGCWKYGKVSYDEEEL